MLRTHGVLTILTSESLSRAGVVQILSRSTSKSGPGMRVFNDLRPKGRGRKLERGCPGREAWQGEDGMARQRQ